MKYPLCRHIRSSGLQCKSPALTHQAHCFYHTRLYQKHSPFRRPAPHMEETSPAHPIQLGLLEDAESVQIAFSQILNALVTGQLDQRLATTLLYGLQMASSNLARLPRHTPAGEVIRSIEPTDDGHELARDTAFYDDWQDDPEEA